MSAHVGALIVLRKSVEVIFLCRRQPATPYTQVRFRFSILNCCRLHFFAKIGYFFLSLKLLFTSSG